MKALYSAVAVSALLCACDANENRGLPVIDIEANMDKGEINDLGSRLVVERVIYPEFTDDSMFKWPFIINASGDCVYMFDRGTGAMMSFDMNDGRLVKSFNHLGNGPEEYLPMMTADFNPATGMWTVFCVQGYLLRIYDKNGKCMRADRVENVSNIIRLPDGNWLGNSNVPGLLYLLDDDFKLMNKMQITSLWSSPQGLSSVGDYASMSGDIYAELGDTIMRYDVSSQSMVPDLVVNVGKYAAPEKYTLEEWRGGLSRQVIHRVVPLYNKRVAFVPYSYQGNHYSDIFDIKSGRLIYRNIAPVENLHVGKAWGVPVKIDGTEVYVWPKYVSDDGKFYCLVAEEEMAKLTDDGDVNPAIVVVDVK